MAERRERALDQLTRLLVVAMLLAVLLNGLPFWARRVGLLEAQAYGRDLARFCQPPVQRWWLPASCRSFKIPPGPPPIRIERLDYHRLYRIAPREVGFKAARYAIPPLLLLVSTALLVARWQPLPPLQALLPLVPLLLSSLLSIAISLPLDGLSATLLSAVWSLWIPLAAVAGWLTTPRRLQILADGAAALVLLQVPFLALEAMRGLPMPFGGPPSPWLPTRLSGLMNQPNTLGGLLAISVALCMVGSNRPWQRWPLLLLSMGLAALARSGGGVVGLLLLALAMLWGHLPRRWRVFPLVVGLVVCALALPGLLGRPQLIDSPTGRLRTLRVWIQNPRTPQERWLGYGVASQSHRQRSFPRLDPPATAVEAPRSGRGPAAEAMPLLLLAQGGVVALVAFYGLLGWCCWQDPDLRPFWAVLLLISLTLNISEVFPLGVWLAVATARGLNRSLRPAGPRG
ncbi:MAG: hypothetical protein RLZZ609_3113 [Cyanobacteriota bacterium]|jgi:hypothetical protein